MFVPLSEWPVGWQFKTQLELELEMLLLLFLQGFQQLVLAKLLMNKYKITGIIYIHIWREKGRERESACVFVL